MAARRRTWRGAWSATAALFALALVVRILPWRRVFFDGQVVFTGNDAYYHARRVLYTAAHFPSQLERDPYLNFPHGGEPIWAPGLDAAAALAARLLGLAGEPETFLAWLPPVLGAATVALVYRLARTHLDGTSALLAAALLALLPAHSNYARIGFFDHHAAVALLTTALLAVSLAWLRRTAEPASLGRDGLLAATAGALLGASLLVWPGMILQVGIANTTLGLALLAQREPGRARRQAWMLAASQAVACLVVAPASLGRSWEVWGAFTPVVLTSFQPLLFAASGLAFASYAVCCGPTARLDGRGRGLRLLAGAGAGLGLALVWLPELAGGLGDALRWFARGETFQREVVESRPLLFRAGQLELSHATRNLTPAIFLLPGIAWFVVRDREIRARGAAPLLVTGWALALGAAALAQARFANSLSVPWSVLLGLAIAVVWQRLGSRPARVVLLVAVAAALAPAVAAQGPYLRDLLAWRRGESAELPARGQRKLMLLDTAHWIRDHTPPTSGFLDPAAQPEYGILSSWTDGHILVSEGRRPAVVSNFGDDVGDANMRLAEEFFRSGETRASRILDDLRARYVILEYRRIRSLAELGPESMLSRLYFGDGQESERGVRVNRGEITTGRWSTEAVDRLRLVHESPPSSWTGSKRPGFKLYEHVAGAELRGRAEPGARVEARLDVRTDRGRAFEFVSSTAADSAGRFRLRIPYATGSAGPGVFTGESLRLTSGAQAGSIQIEEPDVLRGRSVETPSLALPSNPAVR